MTETLSAVILAGGRSSRFGSDKAFASFNGRPLIVTVLETLRPLFPVLLVMTKRGSLNGSLSRFGAVVIEDSQAEHHPLIGLHSGLSASFSMRNFVCACDMPLLQPELARGLCEAGRAHAATVPVWEGAPQPLCGVYSKDCLAPLAELMKDERAGFSDLLKRVPTRLVSQGEVERWDPRGLSFMDVDTVEDLGRAQRHGRTA